MYHVPLPYLGMLLTLPKSNMDANESLAWGGTFQNNKAFGAPEDIQNFDDDDVE